MSRDTIIKTFYNKVFEAKRLNMREIKFLTKDMEQLAFVINELTSEYFSNTIEEIKNNKNDEAENHSMDGGSF